MTDTYTKTVLTIIACALTVIAVRGPLAVSPARAVGEGCGERIGNPCYIQGSVTVDSGSIDISGGRVQIEGDVEIDTPIGGLPVQVQ